MSAQPNEILALGSQIVRELDLADSNDTLGRWMAHHLADLIHQANTVTGEQKAAAETRAVDLTLKLWRHRNDTPGNVSPMKALDEVVSVLHRLKHGAWPYHRRGDAKLDDLLADAFGALQAIIAHSAVLSTNPALRKPETGAAEKFLSGEEREIIDTLREWIDFAQERRKQFGGVRIVFTKEEKDELDEEETEILAIAKMDPAARAKLLLSRRIDSLIETLSSIKSELGPAEP